MKYMLEKTWKYHSESNQRTWWKYTLNCFFPFVLCKKNFFISKPKFIGKSISILQILKMVFSIQIISCFYTVLGNVHNLQS